MLLELFFSGMDVVLLLGALIRVNMCICRSGVQTLAAAQEVAPPLI
jgi:hypothetical protein